MEPPRLAMSFPTASSSSRFSSSSFSFSYASDPLFFAENCLRSLISTWTLRWSAFWFLIGSECTYVMWVSVRADSSIDLPKKWKEGWKGGKEDGRKEERHGRVFAKDQREQKWGKRGNGSSTRASLASSLQVLPFPVIVEHPPTHSTERPMVWGGRATRRTGKGTRIQRSFFLLSCVDCKLSESDCGSMYYVCTVVSRPRNVGDCIHDVVKRGTNAETVSSVHPRLSLLFSSF